jgi:hypothetical protein
LLTTKPGLNANVAPATVSAATWSLDGHWQDTADRSREVVGWRARAHDRALLSLLADSEHEIDDEWIGDFELLRPGGQTD